MAGKGDPGSPWAIGNEDGGHTAVHPELGTLADFRRFVETARSLGMEVALDYALQCSPDHPWVREHPDWFFIRPDGTIKYAENPPKKYEDIYPINFWCDRRQALWDACRDIFLFWIAQGVRTFRVDNPHTKPFAFWEWVIAEVQREHPDTVFLAEAFTRPKRMQALARLGFTQSYTYFTWRNTAAELTEYLTELADPEMADFFRGNFFANTPDILHEYLQHGGRPAFRTGCSSPARCRRSTASTAASSWPRTCRCARAARSISTPRSIRSGCGTGARRATSIAEIARLNLVRRSEPALQRLTNLSFHESGHPEVLLLPEGRLGQGPPLRGLAESARAGGGGAGRCRSSGSASARREGYDVEDLLTGERLDGGRGSGRGCGSIPPSGRATSGGWCAKAGASG